MNKARKQWGRGKEKKKRRSQEEKGCSCNEEMRGLEELQ